MVIFNRMGSVADKVVVDDVRDFFLNPGHWVYQYGSPSSCVNDSPYHRKQIEVLFEKKYFHWITDRAVNTLLKEGFLRETKTDVANFVYRSNVRYVTREINKRKKLIQRYSDPIITRAIGSYAETLFSFLFRVYNFTIVGCNVNEYKRNKWIETEHNLDFIIEKDGISYGVEVKNTLPYMEEEEFNIKIKMCEYLNIPPLWVLRYAPGTQFEAMKKAGGFIVVFKTQIYPPGQEPLVKEMWGLMRLPVSVWKDIPKGVEKQLARM